MIRRDMRPQSDSPVSQWALIQQIDHAHLAGQLAEHWGTSGFAPLEPRGELLWAIYHHDDGWRAWDLDPRIEPSHHRPAGFTEMQASQSLAIWTESIEIAAAAGPLQAYAVAGHFSVLARRLAAWNSDPAEAELAISFVAEYDRRRAAWLAEWSALEPEKNTPEVADRAVAQLQFFDALSLWVCCSEKPEPDEVPSPAGPVLTLDPLDSQRIVLAPWPLTIEVLNLEVPARLVPAQAYVSQAELAAAPSQSLRLRWQLLPPTAKAP